VWVCFNKVKNVAVLIYGRLNKCNKDIIKSVGNHNVDYFISSDNSTTTDLNKCIEIYNPLSYINDSITYKYKFHKYPNKREETNLDTMIRHFINKQRVFNLLEQYIKKTGKQYDVVVSIRTDLKIHSKFNFNRIHSNTIYIPKGNDFITHAINDQIAYGTYDVMKQYMNVINNCDNILKWRKSIPHPESLTLANLEINNIKIVRVRFVYYIYK
jgi:hypothetical protein